MKLRSHTLIAWLRAGSACLGVVLMVVGCTTMVPGRAVSILNDPFRVGGLPATSGPSGTKPNGPAPTGTVLNTNNGPIDKLSLYSINDIEEFWKANYTAPLKGSFKPVDKLVSYDSNDPNSPIVCYNETYQLVNAFFTSRCNMIAWDRGVFMAVAQQYFGDMSVNGVLAHEFGHALQTMAKLVTRRDPTIVREQQADCFAGVYLYNVASGKSSRFTLSTADGLDHVLAGIITTRDPVMDADSQNDDEHGSALDRVSAFQMGFVTGTQACAAINKAEVEQRRGDLPTALRVDTSGSTETGEVKITEDTLNTLMELMGKIFSPKKPPTLSLKEGGCSDAKPSPPASYCPATNTIAVDLPALATMGKVAGEKEHSLPQGDDTALSIVMSRYALAVQHERKLPMQSPWTALRTACLTGVAHKKMAENIELPSGNSLVLTAGDLDEAVAGLLTNHLVASDADGASVPAGFTRIAAFRAGVGGEMEGCYSRYPG
ncbi:neutral zinc metallopeptidase [Mycobacterium asiaticum]|uniref:Peptidase n=1 Tax=Mycobacterium asiaticum TaxID=1790 RepID=A0A1A3KCY7_MYCAS|nr:peptidase [Mycobacterium asiaticum]OBI94017.1 peptidase [Mycobacterium asiaticum]OBJ58439.1 peptidase [Mycobacterium asiaticum]OBJ82253.1 peptidase [Mycobacterium asiaticum]ORA16700.1 peptidase [Mycobacterium asiaticum DSM 44297]